MNDGDDRGNGYSGLEEAPYVQAGRRMDEALEGLERAVEDFGKIQTGRGVYGQKTIREDK